MAAGGPPACLAPERLARSLGGRAAGSAAAGSAPRTLQRLWAGYGHVAEVVVGGEALVVKVVRAPPAPPGDASHARKLRSYAAECAFYRHAAPELRERGVAVPEALDVLERGEGDVELLMRDLWPAFPRRVSGGTLGEASAVLRLQARLHAAFWERPGDVPGVWPEACYWHLATRTDELAATSDPRLRRAARALDERVRGVRPDGSVCGRARTLLHGDPKADNLVLDAAGEEAAAYDFQYAGAGLGAKDVAHFLVSSVDARVLERHEDELLGAYHAELAGLLPPGRAAAYPAEALRDDFDVAVADYVRFMAGWGYWGNVAWAERRARRVLDRLDGGGALASEDEYRAAVAREYPLPRAPG